MSPRYDPWLEKEVPTENERLMSDGLEDLHREMQLSRQIQEETLAELKYMNAQLSRQSRDSSGSTLDFGLFLILLVVSSIAIKVWFFA